MRRIAIFIAALAAWGWIVRLAYQMADARSKWCYFAGDCMIRTEATRDYVLIVGLTVALIAIVAAALLLVRPGIRPSQWRRPSKPAEPTRLQ